jgi:hypothetical protein
MWVADGYHQSVSLVFKRAGRDANETAHSRFANRISAPVNGIGCCLDLPDGQIANRLQAYLKPFVEAGNLTGSPELD